MTIFVILLFYFMVSAIKQGYRIRGFVGKRKITVKKLFV